MATDELPPGDDDREHADDAESEARRRARERRQGRSGGEPEVRERESAPAAAASGGKGGPLSGARRFMRECWAELDRVQWPDRSHLWQATTVVLIACVIVGVYLYALDSVFTRVARWLVDQQTR